MLFNFSFIIVGARVLTLGSLVRASSLRLKTPRIQHTTQASPLTNLLCILLNITCDLK